MASRDYDAILGLGSNVGDKVANIERALDLLAAKSDIRLVKRSKLYRSAPWGVLDQDWFVNACATIATSLGPRALLDRCQSIEGEMRRVRDKRWGPRIIDVDILAYRDETVRDPDLELPHPRIAERAFVLAPLRDVAPDFKLRGQDIDELLSAVDARDVVALESKPTK